jgi:hypothetical protein
VADQNAASEKIREEARHLSRGLLGGDGAADGLGGAYGDHAESAVVSDRA